MTAPTEQEIRQTIALHDEQPVGNLDSIAGWRANLRHLIVQASWPLSESGAQTLEGGDGLWEPTPEPTDGTVWGDLRPSEAGRLVELVGDACDRAADRCYGIIIEELTAAGAAFAAEYPDAPRPKVEVAA